MLERVLVINENVGVREFLYELVSEVGFRALTLPSGKEGIESFKKERPAVVIIDDIPGEFSGILLAKKIRDIDKDVKIVMIGPDPKPQALADQLEELRIAAYLKNDFQDPEIIKKFLSILNSRKEGPLREPAGKKLGSILIVDDETDSRVMVGNFLLRRGFDVDTASSGEECLEKLKERSFDIVLLDITMEGMDGLLTLKRIKDIKSETKVVMVTAIQNKDVLAQAKEMGATDCMIKPFNLAILESSLLSLTMG